MRTTWRNIRRLIDRGDGTAAVEFALIALPFFALVLVILETALMLFANAAVQSSLATAARMIRTGQIQAPSTCGSSGPATIPADFTNAVESGAAGALGSIGAAAGTNAIDLVFDVRSYASFTAAAAAPAWTPSYDDGTPPQPTNNCFDTGASSVQAGSNSIVIVNVAYNYHFITPGLGALFGSPSTTFIPFAYTVIFRNEPF